jgi:(2Fe-2S) ferredoxin
MGTVCYLKGAPRISQAICEEYGIKPGGTTTDRLFTLQAVNCVGACALAPVMLVDGKYYDGVTPDSALKVLRAFSSAADEAGEPEQATKGGEPEPEVPAPAAQPAESAPAPAASEPAPKSKTKDAGKPKSAGKVRKTSTRKETGTAKAAAKDKSAPKKNRAKPPAASKPSSRKRSRP